MKQKFFKLSGVIFLLLFTLNGCKKDDSAPDPLSKVVSPGKQITYFKIVTPAATGVLDTTNKTVSLTVPIGTVLTTLATDISIAAGHTITPASGTVQNFTTPVVYTVKRPDKTTTTWTVTVGTAAVNVGHDITSSVTWTSDKIYTITGDINIGNNSVLTIQPGTVIKFAAGSRFLFVNDSYFYFGYYSNTKISAVGTSTSKITFTSSASSPSSGAWKGLYFASYTLANTQLTYCYFLYTGMSAKPAIYTEKPIGVAYTSITSFSSTHAAEYKTGVVMILGLGNNFTWFAH